ncbi:MAG TPA: hypothetical protein DD706_16045 [Nitrospiraceae bacterium]|nr:hypothetical protein [Nitrospiraceae bacterium]
MANSSCSSVNIPLLHTLHYNVTNTCNLGCSFCYIDAVKKKTADIPLWRIKKLAEEARRVGAVKVILSGGEIFARKDWYEVCAAFDCNGFSLSIVSNGTLISSDYLNRLRDFSNIGIMLSLDGDAKAHDEIRGQNGAHQKTLSAIKAIRASNIPVQVNATIIKSNLADSIYLANLSRELDVSMRFSLLNPYNGKGINSTPMALDVKEVIELREFCHELRKKGSKIFINLPPLLQYPEDVVPTRSPSCGWTKSYCGVTYDGHVTICGVAGADKSLHQGNIMEKPFDEIWLTSPLFNELRKLDETNLKGICARCPARKWCGGSCRLSAYKRDGDFTASLGICQTFYDLGYIPEQVLDPMDFHSQTSSMPSIDMQLPSIADLMPEIVQIEPLGIFSKKQRVSLDADPVVKNG